MLFYGWTPLIWPVRHTKKPLAQKFEAAALQKFILTQFDFVISFDFNKNRNNAKMESEFEVCVIGAGLFGSACAKYAVEYGSKTILVGPREESKDQV
jgi:hypothetical protein